MVPALSVVIPVRNDAAALATTLDQLDDIVDRRRVEVIVAASGDPRSTARAVQDRAVFLIWPEGSTRAELMNAGAAVARAPLLLFLHADTLLPRDALWRVMEVMCDPRMVGGAFAHRFIEPDWRLRVVSAVNRMRYAMTRNYYGDQAQFVRTGVFRGLGGFRQLALMEDIDFWQRLKRLGPTALIRTPVLTSGRRFLGRGPWRTALLCVWLLSLWTCGFDTERYAPSWRGTGGAGS